MGIVVPFPDITRFAAEAMPCTPDGRQRFFVWVSGGGAAMSLQVREATSAADAIRQARAELRKVEQVLNRILR
jgi:hypothetical protein